MFLCEGFDGAFVCFVCLSVYVLFYVWLCVFICLCVGGFDFRTCFVFLGDHVLIQFVVSMHDCCVCVFVFIVVFAWLCLVCLYGFECWCVVLFLYVGVGPCCGHVGVFVL